MRLGIFMPLRMGSPYLPSADKVTEVAQMIEASGIDGIWSLDMIGVEQVQPRPDPLIWLAAAALATSNLEVGTAVYNTAIRHPVDVAQRLVTFEMLLPGRLSLGVGAGSTESADEAMGFDFETRFRRFYENMEVLRPLCQGEHVTATPQGATGTAYFGAPAGSGPRFYLGAWQSEVTMRHVVREYDGWLCSAGYRNHLSGGRTDNGAGPSTLANIAQAMDRYHAFGGTGRTIMSTVRWDPTGPETALGEDEPFNLICSPKEAARRVAQLEAIGFDDLIVNKMGQFGAGSGDGLGVTSAELGQLRETTLSKGPFGTR